MKIGLAQISTTPGDFPGNARRLLHAYREAVDAGADLVMTAALALSGGEIPGRERSACLQALDYLSTEIRHIPLAIGHPDAAGASAVSVLRHEEIRHRLGAGGIYDLDGAFLHLVTDVGSVGECSGSAVLFLGRERFVDGGAEMLRRRLASYAASAGHPLVYCNPIGGGHLDVFPGESGVYYAGGRAQLLPAFGDCSRVMDWNAPGMPLPAPSSGLNALRSALVFGLRDLVRCHGFLGVLLQPGHAEEFAALEALVREALGPEKVAKGGGVYHERLENARLASEADDAGLLLLQSCSHTTLLGGDHGCYGLAPFGELSRARLRELVRHAGWGGEVASLGAEESVLHALADDGASFEDLLGQGHPEDLVLRCLRRLRQTGSQPAPSPLMLRLSGRKPGPVFS